MQKRIFLTRNNLEQLKIEQNGLECDVAFIVLHNSIKKTYVINLYIFYITIHSINSTAFGLGFGYNISSP